MSGVAAAGKRLRQQTTVKPAGVRMMEPRRGSEGGERARCGCEMAPQGRPDAQAVPE
jgi:hypothetical protein